MLPFFSFFFEQLQKLKFDIKASICMRKAQNTRVVDKPVFVTGVIQIEYYIYRAFTTKLHINKLTLIKIQVKYAQ
jgi:hypothetical protein